MRFFPSVAKHTSIRMLLTIVALFDLELEHMDVKTVFLHGKLKEKIYMRRPESYIQEGKENNVCLLNEPLNGLKQSPRQWYEQFDSFIIKVRYNRCG